jgi:hypothetical protein
MTPVAEQLDAQTEYSVPGFQTDEIIQIEPGQRVDLSSYEPLLTAEKASERFGFPTGALQAVIRLPFRLSAFNGVDVERLKAGELKSFVGEDREVMERRQDAVSVYCFRVPEPKGRHHVANQPPHFLLMGVEQIKQFKELEHYDSPSLPQTDTGVLELSAGKRKTIGRVSWLPGVGVDVGLLAYDSELRDAYQSVSRYQMIASVNKGGHLIVEGDEFSYHKNAEAMRVEVGKPLSGPRSKRGLLGRMLLHGSRVN